MTTTGEPRYLSTQQVAKSLGVSVSTVKRWVDEKVLPAHRTIGGHRKLLMSDVIQLVREGNLPQADLSELIPEPPLHPLEALPILCDQLIAALRLADAELVNSLIVGSYKKGYSIEVLADRVIGPAMHQIGHDWEAGLIQIFQEHRATQTVVAALYTLTGQLRPQSGSNRPVAIGGAPENDHSILPSLLCKLVLLECGWEAINLGPHTPMSSFTMAIDDLQPRLVWLSASHLFDSEVFIREYGDFFQVAQNRQIPVAIGGGAFTEPIRKRLLYTTFGDTLSQLAAFARMLHRQPTIPRRGRPAESPR